MDRVCVLSLYACDCVSARVHVCVHISMCVHACSPQQPPKRGFGQTVV